LCFRYNSSLVVVAKCNNMAKASPAVIECLEGDGIIVTTHAASPNIPGGAGGATDPKTWPLWMKIFHTFVPCAISFEM
jgi:hypothetical protein